MGQKHSVRIRLPEKLGTEDVRAAFEAGYLARYGRTHPELSAELIMLRVAAVLPMAKPELGSFATDIEAGEPPFNIRDVYFSSAGRRLPTRVYRRTDLPRGFATTGPAIVEEYSATTIIEPADHLIVGELGELKIDCSKAEPSE